MRPVTMLGLTLALAAGGLYVARRAARWQPAQRLLNAQPRLLRRSTQASRSAPPLSVLFSSPEF